MFERIHHNGHDYVPSEWLITHRDALDTCANRLTAAKMRIAALEDVLRFYADPATYQMTADMDPLTCTFHHTLAPWLGDQGERARAALTPPDQPPTDRR